MKEADGARKTYCKCNGCRTTRYAAGTMMFSMFVAIGVWVSFFF